MFVPRAVTQRSPSATNASTASGILSLPSAAFSSPSPSVLLEHQQQRTSITQERSLVSPLTRLPVEAEAIPFFNSVESTATLTPQTVPSENASLVPQDSPISSVSSPSPVSDSAAAPAPAPAIPSSSAGVVSPSIEGSVSPPGSNGFSTILPPSTGNGEEESDPVKLRSQEQRAAEPGEPSCVVCGRYGEYICDETDDDVCSVECKATVLEARQRQGGGPQLPSPNIAPPPEVLSERENKSSPLPLPLTGQVRVKYNESVSQQQQRRLYRHDLPSSIQDEAEEIVVRDGESGSQSQSQGLPMWEFDSVVQNLTQQEVDAFRERAKLTIRGEDLPRPILEFANCKFQPKLQSNLEVVGYEMPTPVQMQVLPAALRGRDVLVSAGTGSGKTAGYLLSIVYRTCLIRSHYHHPPPLLEKKRPLAIVLTPTRELCVQVEDQAKALGRGLPFKTALVVGGDAMPQQLYRISQGVELIVGTPGRLLDLLAKHEHDTDLLDDVCMLVIDEVDCMLELGFRDQVLQIKTALTQPQILMFSATIPPDIEKFSMSILKRPLQIAVGGTPSSLLPNEAVKQTVIWVESNQKKKKLFDIISSRHHFRPPVVVFVNSRVGAELLAGSIQSTTGIQAAAIHGEKPMPERRQVVKDFLTGNLPIVVATGVLGRGLDLLHVTQVIVFDLPRSIQEYIHQIGRASRLGVPGSAMVFVNDESRVLFRDLVELFQKSPGVVLPKELLNSPYVASSYAASYNHKKRKARHKVKRG